MLKGRDNIFTAFIRSVSQSADSNKMQTDILLFLLCYYHSLV